MEINAAITDPTIYTGLHLPFEIQSRGNGKSETKISLSAQNKADKELRHFIKHIGRNLNSHNQLPHNISNSIFTTNRPLKTVWKVKTGIKHNLMLLQPLSMIWGKKKKSYCFEDLVSCCPKILLRRRIWTLSCSWLHLRLCLHGSCSRARYRLQRVALVNGPLWAFRLETGFKLDF